MGTSKSINARQIIARWPSKRLLAADTGREWRTIYSWEKRNSIPADVDVVMVEAARQRGISLTYEELAQSRNGVEAAA